MAKLYISISDRTEEHLIRIFGDKKKAQMVLAGHFREYLAKVIGPENVFGDLEGKGSHWQRMRNDQLVIEGGSRAEI